MPIKFIIFAILFFFIGRFIVRYVLPIFKITMVTHNKLKDMQQQMQNMQRQQEAKSKPSNKVKEGDYIDYEEVK
ncbi:MAG: hypothetical protein KDC11_01485 [Chitinophagaceae bacterium]|nr:hypothetical protein [Chitinophagaceae bacterium]